MKIRINFLFFALVICAMALAARLFLTYVHENKVLKEIITRLEADSRIAEVLVTGVNYDEKTQKTLTTIKFLEYDTNGEPLTPRYFTFSGNIIQFQSLVIRFDDIRVRQGDRLRGRSVYLFWKVFMLDGKNTQEYVITNVNAVPEGYMLGKAKNGFEEKLWNKFWDHALKSKRARRVGVKNAQIEAPGTMFIPGMIYTIKIEHDGGMRIDSEPIPQILNGERIPAKSR